MKFYYVTFLAFIVGSIIYANDFETFDIVGLDNYDMTIENEEVIVNSESLDKYIYLELKLKNNSKSDFNFSYENNSFLYSPNLHDKYFFVFEGLSIGIYSAKDTIQIHPSMSMYQPALPKEIENDPDKQLKYYKEKQIEASTAIHKDINMVKTINIKAKEVINIKLPIILKSTQDNSIDSYELKKNNKYYLKLFYFFAEMSEYIETNKLDCIVSNTIVLTVK